MKYTFFKYTVIPIVHCFYNAYTQNTHNGVRLARNAIYSYALRKVRRYRFEVSSVRPVRKMMRTKTVTTPNYHHFVFVYNDCVDLVMERHGFLCISVSNAMRTCCALLPEIFKFETYILKLKTRAE